MSTTVTYKGNALTTVSNQTRTLLTAGKYLEDDLTLVDVSGGSTPTLETVTKSYTPTASAITDTITPSTGYDGIGEVDISIAAAPSPWTKVGTTWELTVSNYTSTTASMVGSKSFGASIYTKDKVVYIRIRDKAGKRKGYYTGGDYFFINPYPANEATSTLSSGARLSHRYSSGGTFGQTASSYGVYAYSISSGGNLVIRACYNSTYSLTIDGTYLIDVFTLDYPTGYPAVFNITAVT